MVFVCTVIPIEKYAGIRYALVSQPIFTQNYIVTEHEVSFNLLTTLFLRGRVFVGFTLDTIILVYFLLPAKEITKHMLMSPNPYIVCIKNKADKSYTLCRDCSYTFVILDSVLHSASKPCLDEFHATETALNSSYCD